MQGRAAWLRLELRSGFNSPLDRERGRRALAPASRREKACSGTLQSVPLEGPRPLRAPFLALKSSERLHGRAWWRCRKVTVARREDVPCHDWHRRPTLGAHALHTIDREHDRQAPNPSVNVPN